MAEKPRIGVLFVTSGWFRDVGLQGAGSDTTAAVNRIAEKAIQRLGAFLDPVCPGVLFSADEARKAGRQIRAAGVDGLLLAPLMWCEDQIVRAAIEELRGLPLVLWTFSPESTLPPFVPFQQMLRGSGAVCTLQLSGMFKREGIEVRSVVGPAEDATVYLEIERHARAMAAARALRGLKVGVLPFPCGQMSTTYVDEFALRARYGVELRYLELERVRQAAQAVPEADLEAFRKELAATGALIEVDERNLREGIKYALAMEAILRQEGIPVLAMNDVIEETHRSFGLRPCLANARLSNVGAVIAMEADVAAGIAMHVLRRFTGQPPFYTETFSVDYAKNALLMGHAGTHDSANRDPALPVKIVPDVEYMNSDPFTGAATFFKYRPGPVTAVNGVWDGERLTWTAFEGVSEPGPFKMDGNCHLVCTLKSDVKRFFRAAVEGGVSQHWIVVPGHRLEELEVLAAGLGFGFAAIR
jgi:L-fucose isomerase-like protein